MARTPDAQPIETADAAAMSDADAAPRRDSASRSSRPDAAFPQGTKTREVETDENDAGRAAPSEPVRSPDGLVGHTEPLAVMTGMYARGHERELYATDLGWTFEHDGKIWVLFGDGWRFDMSDPTLFADDAFAQISLEQYPNGRSVEAWIDAHPAPDGAPTWRAAGPEMDVTLSNGPGSIFAPTTVWDSGSQLFMGASLTPMTGFSNHLAGAGAAAYGLFFRYAHVACVAGRCAAGFECDSSLGREALEPFNPPCLVGGMSTTCIPGPGFCQDRSSPLYDSGSENGRTKAVVVRQEVGSAVSTDPLRFDAQAWDTHRFFNATAHTVEDFDPDRALGQGNDYRTAGGSTPERDGVFLWGRPHFAGIGSEGRDAQLFLAWVPMPVRDASGRFEWSPRHFAGLDDAGRPRFVEREVDSMPLDLDAAQSGEQPTEQLDVIGQMSVAWLESMQRFVMIYGGDIAETFFGAIFRSDASKVRHNPRGALFVRFAEQPWGPWTAPRPLLNAGDASRSAPTSDQYGPGGILHHENCSGSTCAGSDKSQSKDSGVLYAPSIIQPWTEIRPGQVDLFWLFSTWNPYQVVLAKTTLQDGDLLD